MKSNLIIIFFISVIIVSCKNKAEQTPGKDSGLIEITKAQFESEEMVLGDPALFPFSDLISFTGSVIPTVNGLAQVSLPLPGIISKIHFNPGHYINKDSALFDVSGNGLIDLQKDFAESSAVLARLKSDYDRAKELHDDNITTHKEFILAESNYYAENAKYNALKIKIKNMGLDVSIIAKGTFYSSYILKSPISGYITRIDATIGQYVEPQQKIAEVVNNQLYQLKLYIFEKDINKVKADQTVTFYLSGNKLEKYSARISSVGKSIMNDTRSIDCYAEILNLKNVNVVSNQFVEGEIYTALDSAIAVPETAIISSENESYLLVFEKEAEAIYYFKKIKVSTGRKSNNFVELKQNIPSKKILISGIYNIQIE